MAPSQTPPFVFLSHSGADAEKARELKSRLLAGPDARAEGLKVWFDKDDLRPGTPWSAQIAEAIRAGDRLPRLCRLRRGDELGRGGGRPRALARHHRQAEPAPVHSGSRRQERGLQGAAALRQALPGRARSARAERRAGEASQGGPRRGLGQAGQAHRRAVRRPAVDAGGGGRPVLRPREGDRGARREIPPASHRRHRRRQRDRQIVAGRGGLRPGLSRRRARRSCAQRARRSRLACRHDAAARQSGRRPAPRRHRRGGKARPLARRTRGPARAHLPSPIRARRPSRCNATCRRKRPPRS